MVIENFFRSGTTKAYLLKFIFMVVFTSCGISAGLAQTVGDYRSGTAIMNWNNPADWESFDGTGWKIASQKPQSSNNVFIQNGHTVTLTGNEACNDLHLSTGISTATNGIDAQLALKEFKLEIFGKLRSYAAPVGTVPGTSVLVNGEPITITPGSVGRISFVGNTRMITEAGEWSANNVANASTFAVEVNLNQGETATLGTVFKASAWSIMSGTFDAGSNRIAVDNGLVDAGDVYIAPGATFVSAKTGTGSNAVLSRGATTNGGSLVVDGTLVLTGLSPAIGMKRIVFNGTIEYARAGNQTFVAGINAGDVPLTYQHIRLTGTGTKTTLANMATIIAENGLLELAGSTTPAVFALGSGGSLVASNAGTRLWYNGPALQTTGAEWVPDFAEIIVDNSAGLTLNTARRAENTIRLTRGNINTTPTRILTIGENGVMEGGSTNSYVNGPLIRVSASVSAKEMHFPIGKGEVYKPVVLTVVQGSEIATNYTAEVFNTAPTTRTLPANELDKVSSIRYFKLTKGSGGAAISQASLKIFYGPDDAVTDTVNLRIARSSASNWVNQGGTGKTTENGSGFITSDINFSTLGDFVLANAKGGLNPLPVTLVYFKAEKQQEAVVLRWQTSCETGSDRYEVERSRDGHNFEKLGTVKAAGTTTQVQNYIFTDNKAAAGLAYYRLKQVDLDGSFVYSKMVTVKTTLHKTAVTVYPNPASDNIYIQAPGVSDMQLEISNAAGQVVLSKKIPGNVWQANQPISISHLPAGVYQLILTDNAGRQSVKLIKE